MGWPPRRILARGSHVCAWAQGSEHDVCLLPALARAAPLSSTIEFMNLSGVFAPIPTPMDDLARVDAARLGTGFEWWLRSGLAGFVVLGSSGEAPLLDDDECDRFVEAMRDMVPRSRTFIVGTGRESTQASVRAARRAAELGADAVLVRTPASFKAQMTTEAFARHYSTVADSSPVPVLLYNFTSATGVDLAPAVVSRLSEHPNVAGIKESNGDVARIAELVSVTPGRFHVLAGSAATFFPALSVGAVGGILSLACVLPDACVRLFELARRQQYDAARVLQQQLMPLARLLGSQYGVPALKAGLKLAGCDVGFPRPPLMPLAEASVAVLRDALAAFQEVAA